MIRNIKLLFYSFPVLIAFIMPFGNALSSPIIALWFFSSLFCIKDIFIKTNLKNKWFIAIISFFLITVLSNYLFFNPKDPISAVEVKLSFIFFPFLFFLFDLKDGVAKRIIMAFVSGCMFASVLCIGRAFMHFFKGDSTYFYYSSFSYFMHSAYFAMYLNLALIFIAVFYFKWFKGNSFYNFFSFGLIALFSLCIILLSSKIGIISLFIIVPFTVVIEYKRFIKLKHYLFGLVGFSLIALSVYLFVPQVFNRLQSITVVANRNIDKTSTESSSVRMLIWNECIQITKENLLTGVGVSKANEKLYKTYEENGLTGAYEKKLNAHNQFFQSIIGLGIFGFGVLFYLTVGVVIHAIRVRNNLLLFFGILITLNFLVESMLQTSAGTVFFVFFLCFLIVTDKSKLTNETI